MQTAASDPRTMSDEELLSRVAAGERDPFLALYDRYAHRLLGLIMTVIRDRHAGEDVLQQVMLEVWQKHAARYQPALGSVEGWLLRLARARAIDQARSAGRRTASALHESMDLWQSLPGEMPAEQRQRSRILAEAIRALPEEVRTPVMLAYIHGHSRDEIAAQLGIAVGTVKTRIRRGVMNLRESLVKAGEVLA